MTDTIRNVTPKHYNSGFSLFSTPKSPKKLRRVGDRLLSTISDIVYEEFGKLFERLVRGAETLAYELV